MMIGTATDTHALFGGDFIPRLVHPVVFMMSSRYVFFITGIISPNSLYRSREIVQFAHASFSVCVNSVRQLVGASIRRRRSPLLGHLMQIARKSDMMKTRCGCACMLGDATMESPHHEEYSSSDFQHARVTKFYHPKRFQMFHFVFSDSLVARGVGIEHSSPGPFWGVCAVEHEKLLSRESWPC